MCCKVNGFFAHTSEASRTGENFCLSLEKKSPLIVDFQLFYIFYFSLYLEKNCIDCGFSTVLYFYIFCAQIGMWVLVSHSTCVAVRGLGTRCQHLGPGDLTWSSRWAASTGYPTSPGLVSLPFKIFQNSFP